MNATPLGVRNEKDFLLNYIRLIPQDPSKTPELTKGHFDFQSHYIQITYEESIFEFGVHGSIFVRDAVDYPTLLPMIGEERIQISFTRPDEKSKTKEFLPPIEFDLPIYQMDGRVQDSASRKRQTYTLYFGSNAVFNNINSVVYRGFKDVPYSTMVQTIYDQFLRADKPIEIEETQGAKNYFIQKLSPAKAIKRLAQRSVSATPGNGSLYVFYEDRDKFNFTTLVRLAKQDPIITLSYVPKNLSQDTPGQSHKPLDLNLHNVNNIRNEANFDVIRSALSGEASGSLLSVDPVRRKFSLKAFDLRGDKSHGLDLLPNSSWQDFFHMGKGKPWTEKNKMFVNPRTNLSMMISDSGQQTQEYISGRDSTVRSYDPEEVMLQRNSQKAQFLRNILTTELSGDPRVKAGCVIKFDIPETLGKVNQKDPEEKDKYLQGNYLVVSVAHILSRTQYKMTLELIRDSFFSDIEARNPVEEYKNIL